MPHIFIVIYYHIFIAWFTLLAWPILTRIYRWIDKKVKTHWITCFLYSSIVSQGPWQVPNDPSILWRIVHGHVHLIHNVISCNTFRVWGIELNGDSYSFTKFIPKELPHICVDGLEDYESGFFFLFTFGVAHHRLLCACGAGVVQSRAVSPCRRVCWCWEMSVPRSRIQRKGEQVAVVTFSEDSVYQSVVITGTFCPPKHFKPDLCMATVEYCRSWMW